MYSPMELREMAESLLDLARRMGPEGEKLDLSDREDFTLEEMVQLRSFLSETRRSIDDVNGALARFWEKNFLGQEWEEEFLVWSVGKTKQKSVVDDDLFLGWVASLNSEQLAKIVNPNRLAKIIKVSGMSPAERDTHIQEEYSQTSGTSINSKEKK